MFFSLFNPMYWLIVGPFLALAGLATLRVKSTFKKYAKVGVRSGMTGAEAAAAVVRAGGGPDVTIEEHPGFLSDHYDPRSKTLRLSPDVYNGRSVSAIAVAAHEAGHSIQDAKNYALLGLRSNLVPLTMIGSNLWIYCFFGGLIFASFGLGWLMDVGIILFGATVLFQLVTLPVEFDASRRAKAVLATSGIVTTQDEARGVEKVLGAAAMTYVAGALTAVAHLIYLLVLRGRD
ncbi:MAG: zinc metallopeptidase [Planctomycetota bacterium]|nr:zinc metallopeptidase [Planctomycetota bacterium]